MAEFARPELIATPEWLAEHLGRPDVRVLDVRWRPDGTAPALYAAGHVPGAVHLDWQSSVVEPADGGDMLCLASPDRIADAMAAAGVGDGTELCCTTTRSRTTRHGPGGACAPTASSRRASSRAASRPGSRATGRSRAAPRTPSRRRSRRGSRPAATSRPPTSAASWARPDVLLVDARGPAEYHGYEGNVRRLGHIPGAVNVPVAAMHLPGHAAPARPGRHPGAAPPGQHHPRAAAGLLRPVGRRGRQARLGPVAAGQRGRRRVRRRLGRVGRRGWTCPVNQ